MMQHADIKQKVYYGGSAAQVCMREAVTKTVSTNIDIIVTAYRIPKEIVKI
jgi:hypothetical protein